MAATLSQSRASGAISQAKLPVLTPVMAQSRASVKIPSMYKSNSDLETDESEIKEDFARVDDNVRIEEQINLGHLQRLRVLFQEHTVSDDASDGGGIEWWKAGEDQHEREAGELTRQEFKDALSQVLGTHAFDHQLDVLFSKLDTSDDGFVDWDEFCTYMLLQLRENDFLASRTQRPFQNEAKIRHIVYNKQETTTRILAMDCPLRFITVSKEGAICFWHPSLNIERHVVMAVREGEGRGTKRRVKTWVTDAIFMANCRKLAISTTGRDIRFFDVGSQNCDEQFQLFGLNDVPCCMYYCCDVKARNVTSASTLIYGDDSGALNVLQFHNPGTQLFNAPFKKEQGVQQVFMQELPHHHTKWVHHTVVEGVHPEPVQKVHYMPDNSTAISSCKGPKCSLVITDVGRNRKAYVFNILKGVECFDYCKNLNTVATGSTDHIVRLWNPYVPRRPVAVLEGHAVSIVDVVIHEQLGLLLSYSKDAMIRVWDLKEHMCIQITTVKFPCTLNGRFAEHGPFALHLQSERPTNSLLVGAGDYIAMLRMGEGDVTASTTPTTHLTQLCAAIYNPYFKQVITGADDSSIGMWDVNTGMKALMFTKCHGNEEITSLEFDGTYKKLVTGARDGSVKVWNVQNGHNLHKLAPVNEAEVTGVAMLTERDTVISVGWNRLILTYDISQKENVNVDADLQWKGGQLHKEDILAMACLPPSFLATASFDGEIYVWSLETERVFIQLRRAKRIFNNKPTTPGGINQSNTPIPSRPNSRHRPKQKIDHSQPVPVDKLLFLGHRAQVKRTEDALLVSSEAGMLYWWSLYGKQSKAGYFYAPHQPDDTVLGLCTDPENTVVITGDSVGQMSVWDIETYCTGSQSGISVNRPPLLSTWHAHDTCIVSVDYVSHDTCGAFAVSASTDKTAKLWSTDGHCVGIFGQRGTWDLRDPKTWLQPREEGQLPTTEELPETPNVEDTSDNEIEESREGLTPSVNLIEATSETDKTGRTSKASKSIINANTESKQLLPLQSLTVEKRSRSVSRENTEVSMRTNREKSTMCKENLLGYKAEAHLIKRQQDRVERRDAYGELPAALTSRMGNLCCPFGALTMQDLQESPIPKNLPVTSRMLNRGYNASTMTQEKLISMNLSLFPPGEVIDLGESVETSPRGNNAGKSRRQSINKLPDIKKNNRVMVKR